ncbi:MAG: thiolase family protein [Planctomycetales bacterium]|nr:thiolase family protein [Planctomycetales bacterium]
MPASKRKPARREGVRSVGGTGRNGRDAVVVVAGVRTPFARAFGPLAPVPAEDLARIAIGELLARTNLDGADVDEVILGCAGPPAEAPNVARVAALMAGLPRDVPAVSVQRNCGSALEALTTAADRIRAGSAGLVIAGGTESMSRYPLLARRDLQEILVASQQAKGRLSKFGRLLRIRPRHLRPVVALRVGLTDPVCGLNMGETAEKLARELKISRAEQDAYAAESHKRALAAAAKLAEETTPVYVPPDYATVVERDVGPREDSTAEKLAKLRPIFDKEYGTVTAGNSCQITDGAVALLVASAERAKSLGYEPLGRLRSHAWVGLEPERMGLGPAIALPAALERAGAKMKDLGLVELNEAFAAQVLACQRALATGEFAKERLGLDGAPGEIPPDRLNVNGGAIALGHPVGATGGRLVLTLLLEMKRRGASLGAATLCVGGGQGGAAIFERA